MENVIRQVIVMNDGEVLEVKMLEDVLEEGIVSTNDNSNEVKESASIFDFRSPDDIMPFKEYEKIIVEKAIKICNGSLHEAARRLKINPSTIYRKQNKWISEMD